MITILSLIINMTFGGDGGGGEVYDQLMSTRIFALITNEILVWVLKIMRKVATTLI